MLEFQKKKKIKKIIYSKLALVIILVLLFFFVKSTVAFYQKSAESKDRKERVETRYEELMKRKTEMEFKVKRLNESVGIEEELRNRFDLVKEGEQTILIGNDGKEIDSVQEQR